MGVKRRLGIYEGLTILTPGVYGFIDSLSHGNSYLQSGIVGLLGLCAGGVVVNLIEEGDRYLSSRRKTQEFKKEMPDFLRDVERIFDDEMKSDPKLQKDPAYLQVRKSTLDLAQKINKLG